jgi:ribonuclease P protein component
VRVARLRRSADISKVRAEGRSLRREGFTARVRRSDGHDVRITVTAPRALGGAVIRGRAKRRVREAFRLATASRTSDAGLDIVITPRAEALKSAFPRLRDDAATALDEAAG